MRFDSLAHSRQSERQPGIPAEMPALRSIAIAGCVAAPWAPLLAQADPKACSAISDDQARLKCFDGIFPGTAADAPAAPEAGSVLERLIGTR
jgi:hypothetical protein